MRAQLILMEMKCCNTANQYIHIPVDRLTSWPSDTTPGIVLLIFLALFLILEMYITSIKLRCFRLLVKKKKVLFRHFLVKWTGLVDRLDSSNILCSNSPHKTVKTRDLVHFQAVQGTCEDKPAVVADVDNENSYSRRSTVIITDDYYEPPPKIWSPLLFLLVNFRIRNLYGPKQCHGPYKENLKHFPFFSLPLPFSSPEWSHLPLVGQSVHICTSSLTIDPLLKMLSPRYVYKTVLDHNKLLFEPQTKDKCGNNSEKGLLSLCYIESFKVGNY